MTCNAAGRFLYIYIYFFLECQWERDIERGLSVRTEFPRYKKSTI